MGINFSNGSSTSGLVADLWRSTTDHQGNTTPLPNWERADTSNQGYIVGMSQSSGIFTFPKTGIYLVQLHMLIFLNNSTTKSQRCGANIQTTTDNANYVGAATGDVHFGGGGYGTNIDTSATASCAAMFDITDTSNHKVRFVFGAGQGHEKVAGNSSNNRTFATFTLIGDT